MLKLNKINKTFASKHGNVQALLDVSYVFPEKGLVSIVGKSGAGKSTLLNILAGLSSPSSGDYYIDNLNSKNLSKKDWDFLRKEYFSFIFQEKNLIDKCTVFDNLKIAILEKNNIEEEIDSVLSLFEISSLKNSIVADLSGGEKQRVAIARAHLKKSRVILADEPSASLDEANTINVFETLKKASKEKLVILVTHDVEFANKYSDSIINISYGKISTKDDAKKEITTTQEVTLSSDDNKLKIKDILFKRKMLFGKQKFTKVFSCILLSLVSSILCLSGYYTFFDRDAYEAKITKSNALNSFIVDKNSSYGTINQIESIDKINPEKYPSVSFYPCYANNDFTGYNLFYQSVDLYQFDDVFFDTIVIDNKIDDNSIVPTDYVLDQLSAYGLIGIHSYEESIGKTFYLLGEQFVISGFEKTNYTNHLNDFDYDEKAITYDVTKMNQKTFDKFNSLKKYKQELHKASDDTSFATYEVMSSKYLEKRTCDFGTTQLEADNEIVITTNAYCNLSGVYINSMDPEELNDYMQSKVGTSIHVALKNENTQKTIIDSDFIIKGVVFTYYFHDTNAIYFNKSFLDSLDIAAPSRKISTYSIGWGNSVDSTNLISFLRRNNFRVISDVSSDVSADIGYVTSTAIFFDILSALFVAMLIITLLFFNANAIKRNKRNIGIAHSLGINHKEITIMLLIENLFDVCVALASSLVTGAVFIIITNRLAMDKGFANYSLFSFNPLIHIAIFAITLLFSFLLTIFIHSRIKKIEISNLLKDN